MEGTRLTAPLIESLVSRGFTGVFVQDEFFPDLKVEGAVSEATWVQTMASLKKALVAFAAGHKPSLTPINRAVDEIIDELERQPGRIFALSSLRTAHEAVYAHSVDVCILSLIAGIARGYSRVDLHKLGVGALLHDAGKVACGDLLTKPEPLSQAERERIKEHSQAGYDLLHGRPEISLLSAHVAFQHHERLDGSGYPRGLRGDEIHEFARTAAVANVFDSLTAGGPHGKRLPPHLAMEQMWTMAGSHLDRDTMCLLFSRVEHYPTGSIAALGTGQVAVVAGQNPEQPRSPRVRVVAERESRVVAPYDLNLAEHPAVTIKEILDNYPAPVLEQLAAVRSGA